MGPPSGSKGGTCFVAKCPMCYRHTQFRLLERLLPGTFETIVIGVICDACNFEVLTSEPEEVDRLRQARAIRSRMEDGEIDESAATAELELLDSRVLARIKVEARTWECPRCHEFNPVSIPECWKCQYELVLPEPDGADLDPSNGCDEEG
jgi:hypothetical protein